MFVARGVPGQRGAREGSTRASLRSLFPDRTAEDLGGCLVAVVLDESSLDDHGDQVRRALDENDEQKSNGDVQERVEHPVDLVQDDGRLDHVDAAEGDGDDRHHHGDAGRLDRGVQVPKLLLGGLSLAARRGAGVHFVSPGCRGRMSKSYCL